MPRSKSFLPDVNVWLALASAKHLHAQPAARWLDTIGENEAAFCRITQMGLLRLLTNHHAMGGEAVSQSRAWEIYRTIASDQRVSFYPEPAGVEETWSGLTQRGQPATNLWTDAYLQAFARLKGLHVVSFDRGFRRFGSPEPLILA